MSIIDDFKAIHQRCKEISPRIFDNDAMTPHIGRPKEWPECDNCGNARPGRGCDTGWFCYVCRAEGDLDDDDPYGEDDG